MTAIRARAEELLRAPVGVRDLALTFEETTASSAEVHVGGPSFFPLILRDVAAATSSVHVNQFGFKRGTIGDAFADALLAKAADGVAVRVVVDGQGSRPDGGSRELYRRLIAGGIDVRVVRATRVRGSTQPRAAGGSSIWNLDRLARIDHRKLFAVDGRIGWVGGGGIEDHFNDGRFHDLFVRLTGPVVSQLQLVFLASFRWLGGALQARELDALFPDHEAVADPIPATVLHNAPGPLRPITDAIAQLLDGARETLDVVNPYVADRAMVGAHRGGRPPRRRRAAVRPGQAEQQAVRVRAAPPPRGPARRGRAHPRPPGDAPRQGVRQRPRGRARGHLQPRRLEPPAVVRARRAAALGRRRGAVRRALLGARRGDLDARDGARRARRAAGQYGGSGALAAAVRRSGPSWSSSTRRMRSNAR